MGTNRLAKVGAATGSLYYFNNNYLGTPLLMTDSSGNVVWDADFKPFGEAHVNDNSSEENNFRFAGQYFDAETGLHYNWHRYYDPLTGRYLTPDPSHSIQPQGNSIPYLVPSLIDSPQDLNNYTYVNGNPINFIDPKGLWIYMGYCRYISGGLGAGVGQIRCRVWTECRSDGYLEVGELVAMFGGLTVGLPASVTYFNIEQNSRDLSKEPTLSDLEGLSSIYSVSSALGIGSSITTLNLGATTGESFGSYQAGVDASLDAFGGYSWIEWSKREKCCE
jgi:RHS repeat-associated protein